MQLKYTVNELSTKDFEIKSFEEVHTGCNLNTLQAELLTPSLIVGSAQAASTFSRPYYMDVA